MNTINIHGPRAGEQILVFVGMIAKIDVATGEITNICAVSPHCNFQSVNEIRHNHVGELRMTMTSVSTLYRLAEDLEDAVRQLNRLFGGASIGYRWKVVDEAVLTAFEEKLKNRPHEVVEA